VAFSGGPVSRHIWRTKADALAWQRTPPQDFSSVNTLFVSLDQQNQQPSSSVFLSQQTSEQYFQPQ
jgi:hypothetical protein